MHIHRVELRHLENEAALHEFFCERDELSRCQLRDLLLELRGVEMALDEEAAH